MDKLKCEICGFEGMSLVTHIKFKHSQSVSDYRAKYGDCQVYLHSEELRSKISKTLKRLNEDVLFRNKNSERQKNGSSCLTTKYWENKGFSKEDSIKKVSELQKNNCQKHLSKNDLQECSQFNKKYWIKRGYSESDSIIQISKLQSKLSSRSSKFTNHIRTDAQKERISVSMKRVIDVIGRGNWAKHFGDFNGRSKAEISFFNYIKENIDASIKANIPIAHYIVDIIKENKIIEFYGDFWHANPRIFSECTKLYPYGRTFMLAGDIWKKDSERIAYINSLGYSVLIIWELDWNKRQEDCIDKIKNYLL